MLDVRGEAPHDEVETELEERVGERRAGVALVDPGPDAAFVPEVFGAIVGGLFLGGVETLAIGLTPVKPLPGAALRQHSPRLWAALYAAALFLFALVLLRPGLADAHERSIMWTVLIADIFESISILFWAYFQFRRERSPEAV